jgi:hypothetical protein
LGMSCWVPAVDIGSSGAVVCTPLASRSLNGSLSNQGSSFHV